MADLEALTQAALDEFNKASKNGNYDALMEYLCPKNVVVRRVDDATPIQGSGKDIVKKFNDEQVNKWPRLDYKGRIQRSPLNAKLVIVSGQYFDTDKAEGIPVICIYHFDKDDKIDEVFATPLNTKKFGNLHLPHLIRIIELAVSRG
jgi:hypothetical protein